jgi:hypothetical protein
MFRSQSYDHHQGSITVLVQLLLIGVHTYILLNHTVALVSSNLHLVFLKSLYNFACLAFTIFILTCEVLNVNGDSS